MHITRPSYFWAEAVNTACITQNCSLINKHEMNPYVTSVPCGLRAMRHEAYTPQMFSIGPLHRDKPELQNMNKEKRRIGSDFFNRLAEQHKGKIQNNGESSENSGQTLARAKCLKVVSELEEEAREWYTEDINLDKHQLAEMLLLDGSFILELFFKCGPINIQKNRNPSLPIDPLLDNLGMRQTLTNDLMLLENQIPFFVLQKLFDLIPQKAGIGDPKMSLQQYIFWFFNSVPILQNISNSQGGTYRHLLDMLHHLCDVTFQKSPPMISSDNAFKISPSIISSHDSDLGFLRCATELYKSGFRIVCDLKSPMGDIKFNEGEISIPQVIIDKSSETLLRNLIALEQVSSVGHSVTSYVRVMYSLIRSPKDADLLESLGFNIIKSEVETNAPDFFQSLCKGVVSEDLCFSTLCKQVNDYHIPLWRGRRLKGYFRIVYFECKEQFKDIKYVVAITGLVVAITGLVVALVQGFYNIFAYYHPPSR